MKTSALQYAKLILEKVSFDQILFQKELRKAIEAMENVADVQELQQWCFSLFGEQYYRIIADCFSLYTI
jgi:hypothetical protein